MQTTTTSTPNRRPSPEREAMLRREIAGRYAQDAAKKREKSGGTKRPVSRKVARMTVAAIERFLSFRWGSILPGDDAGTEDLETLALIVAQAFTNPAERIAAYAAKWAPWKTPAEIDELIAYVAAFPLRWDADSLAERLGLTDEVRTRLNIKTIGAIDFPKEERAKRRKRNDKEYQQERRIKNGCTPRARSAARLQKWELVGMSRSTWYRNGKPTPDDIVSGGTVRQIRRQSVTESLMPTKSSQSGEGGAPERALPLAREGLDVRPSRSPHDDAARIGTVSKVRPHSEVNAKALGLVTTGDTHIKHLAWVFSKEHRQQFSAQPS